MQRIVKLSVLGAIVALVAGLGLAVQGGPSVFGGRPVQAQTSKSCTNPATSTANPNGAMLAGGTAQCTITLTAAMPIGASVAVGPVDSTNVTTNTVPADCTSANASITAIGVAGNFCAFQNTGVVALAPGAQVAIEVLHFGATTPTEAVQQNTVECNAAGTPPTSGSTCTGVIANVISGPSVITATNAVANLVFGTPTITAISPNTGSVGTAVTLTGKNYAANTTVTFNSASGVNCTNVPSTGTSCTVTVPASLPACTSFPCSVNLTASNFGLNTVAGLSFLVTAPTPTATATASATASATATATASPTPGCATVTYLPGDNLVGGPTGTMMTGAVLPMYTFQATDSAYETINSNVLTAPEGFWAFYSTAQTVNQPCVSGTSTTVTLPSNHFVMVGNPFNKAATLTASAGATFAITFNTSSNAYGSYVQIGPSGSMPLNIGQGAWVFSSAGGTLTITSS